MGYVYGVCVLRSFGFFRSFFFLRAVDAGSTEIAEGGLALVLVLLMPHETGVELPSTSGNPNPTHSLL
jgi:hypothetical protein